MRALSRLSVLLVSTAVSVGCAATSSRVAHGFHVECIERASCEAKAAEVCRGSYQIEAMRENRIPDHELPGFNQHPNPFTPPIIYDNHRTSNERALGDALVGPSPEALEPLPLVELDVVCGPTG